MPEYWRATPLSILLGAVLVIAGCGVSPLKKPKLDDVATANVLRYPGIDTQLGEHLYPDEKPIAEKLATRQEPQ